MAAYPKIELSIKDDRVEVWMNWRLWLTFFVTPDGDFSVLTRHTEEIHWAERYEPAVKIAVQTLVTRSKDEDPMATPRLVADAGAETDTLYTPAAPKRTSSGGSSNVDRINDHEQNAILVAILRGHALCPERTKSQIAEETREIAKQLGVRPMAVAGVRAAFTRGTYGDPATEIAAYRRRLEKESLRDTPIAPGPALGAIDPTGQAFTQPVREEHAEPEPTGRLSTGDAG